MSRYAGTVLKQLDRLFGRGAVAALSEDQLLRRFVLEADETAFAALVSRHGPMVLGVCRRILRDEHDVDDAFQATFLVLVRRAGAIRDGALVGHWLYGVAHRVAVRARANAAKRQVHERTGTHIDPAGAVTGHEGDQRDLRAVLDEELSRLPETLRLPVVLCYLEGLTHDEAADRLRWPVGTVRSRMARARNLLRQRLARRNLTGDEAVLSLALVGESVSPALIEATIRGAFAFSKPGAASLKLATAVTLANGVLDAMLLSKLKLAVIAAIAAVLTIGGLHTVSVLSSEPGDEPAAVAPPSEPSDPNMPSSTLLASEEPSPPPPSARRQARTPPGGFPLDENEPDARDKPDAGDKAAPAIEKGEDPPMKGLVPHYFRAGDGKFLCLSLPGADKIKVYETATARTFSLKLRDAKSEHFQVTPIATAQFIALELLGEITQIAVFNFEDKAWFTHDLALSVEHASPIVGKRHVIYVLGSHIYAFSAVAKRWNMLVLPSPFDELQGDQMTSNKEGEILTINCDEHIYDFDIATGEWRDIDVRAIFEAPDDAPAPAKP